MKLRVAILALFLAWCSAPGPASAQAVLIAQSHPYLARSSQEQNFVDQINLQPGEELLPLTMTFYNGTDRAPGFNWVRMSVAGRVFVTEADFRTGRVATVDVTGEFEPGSSQVLIDGAGVKGATFSWRLTTPQVTLSSVSPERVSPGSLMTLYGSHFCENLGNDMVLFNNRQVPVVNGTTSMLEVRVPQDIEPGDQRVVVSVGSVRTGPLPITVSAKPQPVVFSVNLFSGPPGQPLVVRGKNFSPNMNENKVFIGNTPAEVTAASPDSLTVTIPMALDPIQPVWYLPVTVIVDGVRSNSNVTVSVQNRYIPWDEATPVGPWN